MNGFFSLRKGETPYVRWGDWFVLFCVLFLARGGAGAPVEAGRLSRIALSSCPARILMYTHI